LTCHPVFERAYVVLQAVKNRFRQVEQVLLHIRDRGGRVVQQQQLNAVGEVNETAQPLLRIRRSIGLLASLVCFLADHRRSQSKVAASRVENHIRPLEVTMDQLCNWRAAGAAAETLFRRAPSDLR
jgi:hypothetical protein